MHDDAGREVTRRCAARSPAVARDSPLPAIPGTSRHHWGTDLDVYDAAALPADYRLELSPAEVAPGGLFDSLHRWLDERWRPVSPADSIGLMRWTTVASRRSGGTSVTPLVGGLRIPGDGTVVDGLLGRLPRGEDRCCWRRK